MFAITRHESLVGRFLRSFFVSATRHAEEVSHLATRLQQNEEELAKMKLRLKHVEQTRHLLMHDMRDLLSAAADRVRRTDPLRGDRLHFIGHVLPYLIEGDEQFVRHPKPVYTEEMLVQTKELAAEYDFSLPTEPVKAVQSMVYLAAALLEPSHCVQLNSIRGRRWLENRP